MSSTGLRPNVKTQRSKLPWTGVTSIKRNQSHEQAAGQAQVQARDQENTPEGRSILWNADKLTLSGGLLYYRYKHTYQIEEVKCFVVPRAHRTAIDGCHHDAGHQDKKRTESLISD